MIFQCDPIPGQSEDSQDDLDHHLCLHPLLEPLHHLRPTPGICGISAAWNQIRNLNLQVYDCIPNNSTNKAVATFIQGGTKFIMKSEWGHY